MKKIVLTMMAAMVAVVMDAQVYVGGALGFETTSHDGNSTTAFKIKPEVGYTLDENWALGIAFGYAQTGKDDTKVKTLSVNPYARFNCVKFEKVNLFLDGGFEFSNTDSKIAGHKTNTWGIGIKPGVAVNLNKSLSFVSHLGFLGYKSAKPDYSGAKATNTFGVDIDASRVDFGLYYNF